MIYPPVKTLLTLILALFTSLPAAAAEDPPEPRLTTTTFQNSTTHNHYAASSSTDAALNKRTVQNHTNDLWVYDLQIDLTTDIDYDGHFSAFSVSLDLETNFSPYTVYAVMYLSYDNGPWLEYAVTGNFTVHGTGAHDAIFVDSSLDAGYPSGYYDHYVEIYDAYNHSLLLNYGPYENHSTYAIPFESYNQDYFVSPVNVTLTLSGNGSLALSSLLFFISLVGFKCYTRRT